jgi:hypothetical protein
MARIPGATTRDPVPPEPPSPRADAALVIVALVLALGLSYVPYGRYALYPFELLGTWIHEMSHGMTAEVVGFDFDKLTISSDTSGLATYSMPSGANFRRGFVASAGYLGSTLWGCIFLLAKRFRVAGRGFLIAFGAAMALSLIFYVRNLFGFFSTALWAAAFILIGWKLRSRVASVFITFTGGFLVLEALRSINVLFHVTDSSDAVTMAHVWLLPYWFWAGLWMLTSLAAIVLCLKIVLGAAFEEPKKPAGPALDL